MAGTWQRLAHTELGSNGDTFDTGTFTAKDNLRIIVWTKGTTGGTYQSLRFNDDTGSNYAHRRSEAGGNDGTNTSQSYLQVSDSGIENGGGYTVTDITNVSDKEKLSITHSVMGSSSGAGTAPDRDEFVGKWTNTSAQITKIQVYNQGGGDFVAGSYITVFGASSDVTTDVKTTLSDIPANTQYRETDTRKIYRRVAEGTFTSTDYTTSNFTAVGSTVAITSNSAVSTSTPSNTANRVYATIPSLKSTDAWSCDFQLYATADATNDYHTIAFCTNSDAFNTSGQNHISLQTQGGSYQRFVLNARIGGSNSETATSNSTRSLNTNYYCTLSSDGADTARIRIWTNSGRTGTPAQDKTLSIANIGTLTTVMHGTRNSGDSNVWSGTVSNVSLTNPAKWVERGTA